MNRLQFDFLVNKENNTLTITREFAAERQLVSDCHTKQEHLDQWFAPKPMTTKTKSMDFSNGGHWHYAMVTPEGEEYWGYSEYYDIHPIDSYCASEAFSDSSGKVNSDLPTAKWFVKFEDLREHSTVTTFIQYDSFNDLEKVIDMGMKEGMTATLEKLDEYLLTLKK